MSDPIRQISSQLTPLSSLIYKMSEAQTETLDQKVDRIAKKTGVRAVDVLREVMQFHHEKAQDTILGIIVLLKKETPPRGDLLTFMYKEYAAAREIAVDCANKLAPYESAKLQSMEVKSESVHKFVVRTPMQSASTEEWMQTVGAKRNEPKLPEEIIKIEHHNNIDDEEIEELEPIDDLPEDSNFQPGAEY